MGMLGTRALVVLGLDGEEGRDELVPEFALAGDRVSGLAPSII